MGIPFDDAAQTAGRPQYIYVYIGDLPAAGACAVKLQIDFKLLTLYILYFFYLAVLLSFIHGNIGAD
jgi:hypothetical protein